MISARGYSEVSILIEKLGIEKSVSLTGVLSQHQMADLFKRSRVTVSPSDSDGLPNSLLEAMACGSVPLLGSLDSVSDILMDGQNCKILRSLEVSSITSGIVELVENISFRESLRTKGIADAKLLTIDHTRGVIDQFYKDVKALV